MVLHPHLAALHRDTPIIGLTGFARSGKDTVAAGLVAHGFTRFAFADALREAALALNPIINAGELCIGQPDERLADIVSEHGWEAAKGDPEVRRVLQHYGTAIRAMDEGFWVRPVMAAIERHRRPAVITDVRFRNEADAIRRRGGLLVRVVRAGVGPVNGHVSETELADTPADWVITNDSGLEALRRNVDNLAKALSI